jgi:hypothetical protein
MKHEIIKVTPGIAKNWLNRNPNNRSINEKTVREYTADMLHGRWKYNGEAVKFDVDGHLIDGQHRLNAIVMSNTAQDMLVVRGLDPQVFDSIDIGRMRSTANVMEVKKIPHFNRAASALAVVVMYDKGVGSRVRDRIKPNQSLEWLDRYPELPEAIDEIGTARPLLLGRSLFDGLYYIFRRLDKPLAMEYMLAIRDGVGIEALNAWRQLRERLIRNYASMNKLDEVQIAALIIKGWNIARQGRDSAKLGWAPAKEDFPRAI